MCRLLSSAARVWLAAEIELNHSFLFTCLLTIWNISTADLTLRMSFFLFYPPYCRFAKIYPTNSASKFLGRACPLVDRSTKGICNGKRRSTSEPSCGAATALARTVVEGRLVGDLARARHCRRRLRLLRQWRQHPLDCSDAGEVVEFWSARSAFRRQLRSLHRAIRRVAGRLFDRTDRKSTRLNSS